MENKRKQWLMVCILFCANTLWAAADTKQVANDADAFWTTDETSEVIDLKKFYSISANQKELLSLTKDSKEKVFLQQFLARLVQIKTKIYFFRGQLLLQSADGKKSHKVVPIVTNQFFSVDNKFVAISKNATDPEKIADEIAMNMASTKTSLFSSFVSEANAGTDDKIYVRFYLDAAGHVVKRVYSSNAEKIVKPYALVEQLAESESIGKYFEYIGSKIECHSDKVIAKGSALDTFTFQHNKADNFTSVVSADGKHHLKVYDYKDSEMVVRDDVMDYFNCFNPEFISNKKVADILNPIYNECKIQLKIDTIECFYKKTNETKKTNAQLESYINRSQCQYKRRMPESEFYNFKKIESCDKDFKNCQLISREQLMDIGDQRSGFFAMIERGLFRTAIGTSQSEKNANNYKKELSYATNALLMAGDCCKEVDCRKKLLKNTETKLQDAVENESGAAK